MTVFFDHEVGEDFVPSAFVGWREDADALAIERWPRWEDHAYRPADFGAYLAGVMRQKMYADFKRVSDNWRAAVLKDFDETRWDRVRRAWRKLWPAKPGPSRHAAWGDPVPLKLPADLGS